jgi:hypothetical protein
MLLVGSYGFVALFLHRLLPAMLLVGFILLLAAGVQPRKYRLAVPGLDYHKLLPLDDPSEQDKIRPPLCEPPSPDQNPATLWGCDNAGLLRIYDLVPHADLDPDFPKNKRDPRTGVLPKEPKKRPVVIICVSGGGLRAAVWAHAILRRLDSELAAETDDQKGFSAHVRVIAGASGGMLGASYYVSTLPGISKEVPCPRSRDERQEQLAEEFRALAGADFLTPIAQDMMFRDLPHFFSPWPRQYDRGMALQDAWVRDLPYGLALRRTFAELKEPEQLGRCPSLIFSPMVVEDGRRLLLSNLDLRYVASNDGNLLNGAAPSEQGRYSREALEFGRLFPDARMDLATAARLSASFAYFSPSPHLPTIPTRRVVDAGYYDNDGTSVAASFLFSGMNTRWFQEYASGVVLIQIRDTGTQTDRRLDPPLAHKSATPLDHALEQLTTPPEALYRMRIASTSFRNDGLLELLSQTWNEREQLEALFEGENQGLQAVERVLASNAKLANTTKKEEASQILRELQKHHTSQKQPKQSEHWFTVVNFEFARGNEVSLSRYLTKAEREKIAKSAGWSADGNQIVASPESKAVDKGIEALRRWWRQHASSPPPPGVEKRGR